MSRTAVIVSDAEDSTALCRLCMIYHEHFVNIFIPNNTFRICAEEAIHDLLSLKVAVGDGLPSNICHQCVKKLMDFRDFKEMCLKTAAELRKCDLDNFLKVSKIKDEDAADMETSREGSSQENTFVNDIHMTEVYVTVPDELAMGNVSPAKELWSCDNALVVKEEVYDGEHCIESDVPVNAYTSVAVDPLAVDMMALKEEAHERDGVAGEGYSLGDTSPHNHIQVTEVFVPVPDKLSMGIVSHAEEDSRSTELMVKEEIGEGLDSSEIDAQGVSLSSVNVDPLAVDTSEDCRNSIEDLTAQPEMESHKFGADRQGISQVQVLNNPSYDPVHEDTLQLECSKPNSFSLDCFPERRVRKQKKNVKFNAPSKNFSRLSDKARPVGNHECEKFCHQAENNSFPTEYVCNYCNTRYAGKNKLALHIKRHVDGMRSASVLPKQNLRPRFSQDQLVKAFKCKECGKMFHRSDYLIMHSRIHSGVKPFKCDECGKMFTRKGDLRKHSRIHSGVKPFKCDECGKMFHRSDYLLIHSRIHSGMKPFKCDECGKMFSRKGDLSKHSRIHSGVKPFKCDQCGKIFTQKSHLKTHSVVHTGVKLFKCNECGNMFPRKIDLKTHLVVHTGVKRFKCIECGKMFSKKSHLTAHSVVHTGVKPFKCNECGKMFNKRGNLITHFVVHTGGKTFKCNECGNMFTRKSVLKRHLVVHTGEKRFKCNNCGKKFTQSGTLRRHSRVHSGGNPL